MKGRSGDAPCLHDTDAPTEADLGWQRRTEGTMQTTDLDRLFGYNVIDSAERTIGSVDGVWVDDATDQLEFVGVGGEMGRAHIVPAAQAEIGDGTFRIPYSEEQVRGAPSFDPGYVLTGRDELEIYRYYGLERTTSTSPSGLPSETASSGPEPAAARTRQLARTEREEVPIADARRQDQTERIEQETMSQPQQAWTAPTSAPAQEASDGGGPAQDFGQMTTQSGARWRLLAGIGALALIGIVLAIRLIRARRQASVEVPEPVESLGGSPAARTVAEIGQRAGRFAGQTRDRAAQVASGAQDRLRRKASDARDSVEDVSGGQSPADIWTTLQETHVSAADLIAGLAVAVGIALARRMRQSPEDEIERRIT